MHDGSRVLVHQLKHKLWYFLVLNRLIINEFEFSIEIVHDGARVRVSQSIQN